MVRLRDHVAHERDLHAITTLILLCHLENWDGHPGSSALALTANVLSLALPLMLLCLLLFAAGLLRTAFPHQRSGKILISGVGLGGRRGEAALLLLAALLWLHPACYGGKCDPAQLPRIEVWGQSLRVI